MYKKSVLALWLLFALFLTSDLLKGQCLEYELSLEDKLKESEYVFEAKVLKQQAFVSETNGQIYTCHSLLPLINFKTAELSDTVFLITRGGETEDFIDMVFPSLQLSVGDKGVFLLRASNIDYQAAGIHIVCEPVGYSQGFIRFHATDKTYLSTFKQYPSKKKLHHQLSNILMEPVSVLCEEDDEDISLHSNTIIPNYNREVDTLFISSFNKIFATAGNHDTLTIYGEGFDEYTDTSYVQFRNVNFPNFEIYESVLPELIVSWTDTEIKVVVPGKVSNGTKKGAGTGRIKVINRFKQEATSEGNITILYNKLSSYDFYGELSKVFLINNDNAGGYTLYLDTNFHNNPFAKAAIERAVETWRCNTGLNYKIANEASGTTCVLLDDNINTISFDFDCPLMAGALAGTSVRLSKATCSKPVLYSFDMVFATAINWNFTQSATASSQVDFESIALHELGHSHGCEHVLDYEKTMHPSTGIGFDRRFIDGNTQKCGKLIISQSQDDSNCGSTPIIPVTNCDQKRLYLKVFLEAPYMDNSVMNTQLSAEGILPLTHPYHTAPWNYSGSANVNMLQEDIVDWILVEALDSNYQVIEKQAALLKFDGSVLAYDHQDGVLFNKLKGDEGYYIMVRHRNHLDIISKNMQQVNNMDAYDFSIATNVDGGTGQLKELEVGEIYGMKAGDFDGNGAITVADYNEFQNQISLFNGYYISDCNLDGAVTIQDFNLYKPNGSAIGNEYVRY